MSIVPKRKTGDTQVRILDAAEQLFVERGYSATSLRAIANEAEVNLAATNYHFGTKEGLLAAVIHRHMHPVNEERIKRLSALEESGGLPTLRNTLEALFYPLVDNLPNERLPAVMGRILSEPESLSRPIITEEFAEVGVRFQTALSRALPVLSSEELAWRFHLMTGSMIHLLKFPTPIVPEGSDKQFRQAIEHLIDYSIAGLSHGTENDHV